MTYREMANGIITWPAEQQDQIVGVYPPQSCPEGDPDGSRFVPIVAVGHRARLHGDKEPVLLAGPQPVLERF